MSNTVGLVISLVFLAIGVFAAIKLATWKAKKDHEEFIRPYDEYIKKN